jgi:hypothetical protein
MLTTSDLNAEMQNIETVSNEAPSLKIIYSQSFTFVRFFGYVEDSQTTVRLFFTKE